MTLTDAQSTCELSAHFSLAEFIRSDAAERLGNANTPTPEHLAHLTIVAAGMEKVRTLLGDHPIAITSGYRNPVVNHAVGGVPDSDHALGYAVDFTVAGLLPRAAGLMIERSALPFDQLIHEVTRQILHISFNPRMRRQVLTQRLGPGTPFEEGLTA